MPRNSSSRPFSPVARRSVRLAAWVAGVTAISGAGVGVAFAQQASPPGASAGVPVQAASVVRRDTPVMLRNVGLVQPLQTVLVRARVDGTLDSINFREGQEVKPGDLLAQIDPRPYLAVLNQTMAKKAADEAQLANAKLDLGRYSELAKKAFATRQSVDTQQAMVAQLTATIQGDQAAIDTARLNLEFTHITSPLAGRVGLRMIDPGNLIHATDPNGLVTITQIHPISVIFTLPQDTLPDVMQAVGKDAAENANLPVQAMSSDDKVALATGTLLTVDNAIDQTTGTYRLKAVFENNDNKLWPGQFVNAHLQVAVLKNALVVPSSAIQRGPDGLFIYMVKPDNTVATTKVEVRQDDGDYAVIDKGLAENVRVVTNGQSKLQNGSRVAVTVASAS